MASEWSREVRHGATLTGSMPLRRVDGVYRVKHEKDITPGGRRLPPGSLQTGTVLGFQPSTVSMRLRSGFAVMGRE